MYLLNKSKKKNISKTKKEEKTIQFKFSYPKSQLHVHYILKAHHMLFMLKILVVKQVKQKYYIICKNGTYDFDNLVKTMEKPLSIR